MKRMNPERGGEVRASRTNVVRRLAVVFRMTADPWRHLAGRHLILLAMSVTACTSLAPMTTSPRDTVAAKFAAVNRHAIAEIVEFYAADARLIASDFCAARQGRADVERTYRAIFDAVPDVIADVQEYVVEGERVAVRLIVRSRLPGRSSTR